MISPASPRPSMARRRPGRGVRSLAADGRGAVLVETAIALPVLLAFLMGILTYGAWFITAHSVQQAANEAARAALAGLDPTERRAIATASVTRSVSQSEVLARDLTQVSAAQDGNYLTVRVDYAVDRSPLFAAAILPLPAGTIRRTAVIELPRL